MFKKVTIFGTAFDWYKCNVYTNERDFDMHEMQTWTITMNDDDIVVDQDQYDDVEMFGARAETLFEIIADNVAADTNDQIDLVKFRLKADGALHYYFSWLGFSGANKPDEDVVALFEMLMLKYQRIRHPGHNNIGQIDIVVCPDDVN
jgi:hypothetical protein